MAAEADTKAQSGPGKGATQKKAAPSTAARAKSGDHPQPTTAKPANQVSQHLTSSDPYIAYRCVALTNVA